MANKTIKKECGKKLNKLDPGHKDYVKPKNKKTEVKNVVHN